MKRLSPKTALCLVVVLISLATGRPWSQTVPVEGLRDNTPKTHVLINVRIVPEPGRVIEKGTIVLRDGTIEAVGGDIPVPADARVWDYDGMTVYPGLIEMYSHLGLKKEKKKSDGDNNTNNSKSKLGSSYWNTNVTPERDLLAPDRSLEPAHAVVREVPGQVQATGEAGGRAGVIR